MTNVGDRSKRTTGLTGFKSKPISAREKDTVASFYMYVLYLGRFPYSSNFILI